KPPKGPHGNPNNPPQDTTTRSGCLLLDFDGEVVSNTLWNINGPFTCASSGLSADQQVQILARVRQDYSAFNVTVTTDEAIYNTYPQNKRRRCIITTSWEWYGYVGGVAYLNSFNWYDDSPCFVFSSLLGFNTKYISDAISHEFGHTFGCRHKADYTFFEDGSC